MVIFHSQRIQKACADMLTMRKHGGGMTKTLLWKNANPTATFAAQNVTLSEKISNFDAIMVEYRFSIYDSRTNSYIGVMPLIANGGTLYLVTGMLYIYSDYYKRPATAVGGTLDITWVSFDSSKNSLGNTDNSILIPLNIYGIKGKIS